MKKNDIDEDLEKFYGLVGRNVAKHREIKKVSQLTLAHGIGHDSTTIISLAEINNTKHFSLKHLYKISKYLDIDICDLIRK